jgi:hypothetical protein
MSINFFTTKRKGAKRVANTRRIHAKKVEFEAAETNGEVYGHDYYHRVEGSAACVYVELGEEKPYTSRESDDLNIEYKYFSGCRAYYARTFEDLDSDVFISFDLDVILYC